MAFELVVESDNTSDMIKYRVRKIPNIQSTNALKDYSIYNQQSVLNRDYEWTKTF